MKVKTVKHRFKASVWKEGKLFIAQCLDIEVASQGRTEKTALKNLTEALELYFEEPRATNIALRKSKVTTVEAQVQVSAA